MRRSLGLAVFLMASIAGATDERPSHHHHAHGAAPPPHPASVSLGYANSGRLQNAARLDEDEAIRYVPGRPLHYGTDELIGLIRRSARSVQRHYHTRLSVGDLSASGGGPVGHHASHQSGRDADLSFYVVDAHGESVLMNDYLSFGREGIPFTGGPLRFDTARNWALIEALLTDSSVSVEHVFVSNPLRSLLLHYARNHGVDANLVTRAENTLVQPPRGSPHTNHFHVRIGCPAGDASCLEGVRHPPRRGHHPRAVAGNAAHHAVHAPIADAPHVQPHEHGDHLDGNARAHAPVVPAPTASSDAP